ncbi:MAG: CoA-binding protein, partial [Pseudomonadota bacterium]
MPRDLSRLLAPKSLAVVGGGAWCTAIVDAARKIGFEGYITPVHPTKATVAGLPAVARVADLPAPPDAAFVGVNRHATIQVVQELREAGAGGAICFASGFSEAQAEDHAGSDLQARLVQAAGDMPILGPNCYGFLNAFDRTGIWPDQHGLRPVQTPIERGVAILTQSSNIAINLTMQARGLPLGMMITCGNMAQTSQAEIARRLLDDPRVTAIGLHIEGFGALREWEALATQARARGVPLIALKSGRSTQARAATISHTASLAGDDAGAAAFLRRLGIARLDSLPAFLEALKLAHLFGHLPNRALGSISCSGGEASLVADTAVGTSVHFPPLSQQQRQNLSAALGPMVSLANPLDYHTYIWRDVAAMTRAWAALAADHLALILVVLDYPRSDTCDPADWDCATQAVIAAAQATGQRYALVATLPELLPEETARHLMAHGVAALHGLDHAIAAMDSLAWDLPASAQPVLLPRETAQESETLTEAAAKDALADYGLRVPVARLCETRNAAAKVVEAMTAPAALKVQGLAHKTGAAGLALGVQTREDVLAATLADGPLL